MYGRVLNTVLKASTYPKKQLRKYLSILKKMFTPTPQLLEKVTKSLKVL